MRKYLSPTFVVVVMLLSSACTTEVVRPGANLKKAAEANAKLGVGYMRQGNYELAMAKLKKALKFDEENPRAHHYMAELHRRLGENEKAEHHYKKAIEFDPKDTDIQNNYGVFLCELGRYKTADKHFRKVLENPLYTTRSKVYENIGLCAKRKGDLKKAERNFHKALVMDSRLAKSLLEMAQLSYDRGNTDAAYDYYQRYLRVSKQNAQSLWVGVLLEKQRGNTTKAASYALLLRKRYPQSKEAQLAARLKIKNRSR